MIYVYLTINNQLIFILLQENYFTLDLSICSPNIYLDFDWSVLDDLHGSDHFPVKIEEITSTNEDHHSRWNLNKANWENFYGAM